MALQYAGIEVEHREIELRNKPSSMLQASPKGTVPVLCIKDKVIDQSLDIMRWALEQNDPEQWLRVDKSNAAAWIEKNDGPFKKLLDQYKYPNRHPELKQEEVLNDAIELMLAPMDKALNTSKYLMGNQLSWVDIAIFPFIRQFSMVDQSKFDGLPCMATQQWLQQRQESPLFNSVMDKYPVWKD